MPPPPRFCLATEAETNHSSLFGNSCQAIFEYHIFIVLFVQ